FITRHRVLLLSGPTMQRNPNQLVRTTDARGQIAFEDVGIVRIVAASRAGFALAKPADFAQDLKLRLAPWGRVEGCLLKRGKPETGLAVRLQSDVQTTGLFINTEEVMTDAGGNFAFQYAPTGKFGLTRRQKVSDLPSVYENLKFKDVEISPGQTMVVNTDDLSFEVRAQLTFPPNFEIGPNQRMHIKIISRMPGFDPGLITDQQAMRQYLARPEAQAALPEMRQWEMHEREPGIWSAANVPPGSWTLQAMVLEPVSKTASMVTSLLGYWDIEIPESSIEESFDLGNFILKPSSGKVP
ncbi:MAG: resA 1, partial [Verrucomicrobiales bacterium]|nr:resA 1 [Verrucomicrobiales bacterium]